MAESARIFEIFMAVQRGLPRQGPGCAAATLQALALCRDLPARPAVLDIGCGPGLQSLALAGALDGRVAALDLHVEYLTALRQSAEAAGLAERLGVLAGDMTALPFAPRSFDLIWSEGAAYIMGFCRALEAWRPLLKPGGCLVVSEMLWLRPDPPAELTGFFAEEYPAMADGPANDAMVRAAGYDLLGAVTLPEAAWWDDYYGPLAAKLPSLRADYAGDEEALAVVRSTKREIEMRRRFADWYGYRLFVGRRAP